MDLLTREDLEQLVRTQCDPCISIFVPMVRTGRDTRQNHIRFRNQVQEAEHRLVDKGYRRADAERWLAPASALFREEIFWRNQSDGLAAYIGPDFMELYRAPVTFSDEVHVSDHFVVAPLLPLLLDDSRFYVLAMSQEQVRLLLGTKQRVEKLALKRVPSSLHEAIRYDTDEQHIQHHETAPPTGPTGRPLATFHGHGLPADADKDQIRRFCIQIDRGLKEVLRQEKAPLVLAGVDYERAIYREVNTYQNLLDEGIDGNPEQLSNEQLHAHAWKIVEPWFRQEVEQAAAQYRQLHGTGRATCEPEQVVRGAGQGSVHLLMVTNRHRMWGHYNAETGEVQVLPERTSDAEELVDRAVTETLLRHGVVYALDPSDMPEDVSMAAIFRY